MFKNKFLGTRLINKVIINKKCVAQYTNNINRIDNCE